MLIPMCRNVGRHFYFDDELESSVSAARAVDLVQQTKQALQDSGGLKLHKKPETTEMFTVPLRLEN